MGLGQRSGPPSWFVILVGIAIVFGLYYLWLGLRSFMATGVTVPEATQQAIAQGTATASRIQQIVADAPTPLPSFTPVPPCQDFVVRVPIAIVRAAPSTESGIVAGMQEGETVCVIAMLPDSEWYMVDQNANTRRLERVYMRRDIIGALNPTPRPSATPVPSDTPPPTITPAPSATPAPPFTRQPIYHRATAQPASPTTSAKAATAPSVSL